MKAKSLILKLPFAGRFAIVPDRNGQADGFPGGVEFHTNLSAQVIRNGRAIRASEALKSKWFGRHRLGNQTTIDLGSGLVTNVGALSLANDWQWSPIGLSTLRLANQHMTGTGVTAAAATDIKLQTISTMGGQTAVAGTQSTVTAANSQKYQTVATIAYTGTEAVTEWGLHSSSTQSSTLGSPFTAVSGNTVTVTGTPLTASSPSVRGLQGFILVDTTANAWGLIISNTTSTITVAAWYKITDGTVATTPGSTDAYTLQPVLWDHKTFAAINVVSGDSIQFTYTLTVTSGG